MSQRKIFLSYSHQDQDFFDAFRTHLSPFEREGALLVWSDASIRPAEDWDRRIHAMMDDADAAVVLVSPDAIASDYVVEKEIGRLVERAEAGHLLLTCLYLRSASIGALTFDTGTGERVALTCYQGLNTRRSRSPGFPAPNATPCSRSAPSSSGTSSPTSRAGATGGASGARRSSPWSCAARTGASTGAIGRPVELVLRDGKGAPRFVALARILKALEARPPAIVFLNTVGDCPLADAPAVPVLVHVRHEHADRSARQLAQTWWSDVLETGWDPVCAFHEVSPDARRRAAIRTSYESFETRLSDVTPKVDRPRSRLDRRVQREAVMSLVRDLATNRHRRVAAGIVYGAEGNLVEHFAVQIVDTLKDWAHGLAGVQRHDLRFPDSRDALAVEDFVEILRDAMHLQPEQDLSTAFATSRRRGPSRVQVHFLNWGCYGPRHRTPLKASHLEAWLAFCRGPLAAAVNGNYRILSYVALVVPPERYEPLRQRFDAWNRQPHLREPHFEMQLLQPLQEITPKDLDAFLSEEDNTSCPPEYRHDIAERIVAATGGEFEATVQLLEEAERGMMWPDLYHTLPKMAPARPELEDFELS